MFFVGVTLFEPLEHPATSVLLGCFHCDGKGSGFKISGLRLGIRVLDFGFRVLSGLWILGLRVYGLGVKSKGGGFRVYSQSQGALNPAVQIDHPNNES